MRVVRRYHKAVRKYTMEILTSETEAVHNPVERITQKRRFRALLASAPRLLIIKDTMHVKDSCPTSDLHSRIHKSEEGAVAAFQVIQLRTRDKLPIRAPDRLRCAVHEKEILSEDFFSLILINARGIGDQLPEPFPVAVLTEQRKHVFLHIISSAVIGVPVHVNRQRRNHQKVPVNIHQSLFNLEGSRILSLCSCFLPVPALFNPEGRRSSFCSRNKDQHTSRDGKRPVKPCTAQHPAVFFNIQLDLICVYTDLRRRFYLEGRRITVTRDDMSAPDPALRQIRQPER